MIPKWARMWWRSLWITVLLCTICPQPGWPDHPSVCAIWGWGTVLCVFQLFPLGTDRSSRTQFLSVPSLCFSPVLFVGNVQTLRWWDGDMIRCGLQGGEMWFCWQRLARVWEQTAWSCERVCLGHLSCFPGFVRGWGCLAYFVFECPERFFQGFSFWILDIWEVSSSTVICSHVLSVWRLVIWLCVNSSLWIQFFVYGFKHTDLYIHGLKIIGVSGLIFLFPFVWIGSVVNQAVGLHYKAVVVVVHVILEVLHSDRFAVSSCMLFLSDRECFRLFLVEKAGEKLPSDLAAGRRHVASKSRLGSLEISAHLSLHLLLMPF